jgi:mitochondrial fission protein ELM1
MLIWVLDDGRPGHRSQGEGIAEGLGWAYEVKQVRFTRLDRLNNRLLGPTRASLDRARSDALKAPWPDLVISPGRRTVPIARWIKRQARGRPRLVQLGRKGGHVAKYFDLVVSSVHFNHFPHQRRIELMLPLHKASPERLAAAAARWPDVYGEAPAPHVLLLVGGRSLEFQLDGAVARQLARRVRAHVEEAKGSLVVVTSRRTGLEATAALRSGLAATDRLYEWNPTVRDSPYLAYLSLADVIIVTGDSESMLAEASATGRPLYIYSLPERRGGLKRRFKCWAFTRSTAAPGYDAANSGIIHRLIARLWLLPFRWSVLRAPRDPSALHRALERHSIARPFGAAGEPGGWRAAELSDRVLLREIRALMDS